MLIGIIVLISTSISITFSSVSAQTPTTGLGVGRNQGTETGINLTALNQLKAEIATGAYDRPCTAAEHDPTRWHTLVNTQAKCHYDHMHGDDPTYVNDLFGEPGAWFGSSGQSVSYPWQTFKATTANEPNTQYVASKQMENDLKHEGYIWVVRRDQPCPNGNCITDFRVQTHAIFGAHDMPVRFHSFSLEARLCLQANNPSSCGIVRYGGWIDMGRLFTTQPGVLSCTHDVNEIFIPLPADTQYFPIDRPNDRDEVRCHPNITNLPAYPSQRPLAEWWGHGGGETRFQLRVYDPIGNVDPTDPSRWHFFCAQTDVNCRYDASIFSMFVGYTLHIHEFIGNRRVDANRDGRTDFKGYMNRWGQPASGCSASALDCIPYEYNNVGLNFSSNKEARYVHSPCENCARVDHDISRSGQKWITWFYRYASPAHNQTPTATVVPPTATLTNTPLPPTATATETPLPPTATTDPGVPTATETPPTLPSDPTVRVDLSRETANVGEQIEVLLNLFNVTNLYGLQAQCTTTPTVLAGVQPVDGDAFNQTNSFFVNNQFKADTGSWTVAASRLQPNTPISGNALAFKLQYNVVGAGSSPINCAILGVDANGQELPLTVVNTVFNGEGGTVETPTTEPVEPTDEPTIVVPTATVEMPTATATESTPIETLEPGALSTISGTAQYQNRPDHAGITVQLLVGTDPVVSLTTNANGAFSFTDVPAGTYSIQVSANGHLSATKSVTVTGDGQIVETGTLTLLAGDTDNNGTIDIADAGMIGANFGVSVPPAPAEADLNSDTTINIRDLVLVGGNFSRTGPIAVP